MSMWGRVFAVGYDFAMAGPEKAVLSGHRKTLLGQVYGSVLELGGGTGANLPYFGEAVTELVVTEPEDAMVLRLEKNLVGYRLPAKVVRAPAEDLPFEAETFDFVVSILVLCTVDDTARALAEVRRVLKPGGRLVFVEHIRSDDLRLARWQDRLHRVWLQVGYGCHCNRTTMESIERAGFSFNYVDHDRLRKAVPIIQPLIVGTAEVGN